MEQEATIKSGHFGWHLDGDAMVQRCVECGKLTRGVNGYGVALCLQCASGIASGEVIEQH